MAAPDNTKPTYYVGDFRHDAESGGHRGWFIGTFVTESPPRKTEAVEVMHWAFDVGRPAHPLKTSSTFECTLILKGRVRAVLDGEELELGAGQYVAIPPGVENNLVAEILEPAEGITIKAPSDPTAKKVVQRPVSG